MSRPAVRHVLLAVTVVFGTFGVLGALHTGDLPGNGDSWALGLVAIGNAGLGWLVIGRRPELSIGWMFLVGGVVGAVVFVSWWWAQDALVADPGSLPAAGLAVWLALSLSPVQPLLALVVPVATVPDGVPRSRRWRLFLVVVSVAVAALMVAVAVVAAPVAIDRPGELVDDPDVVSGSRAGLALGLDAAARLVVFAAMVVSLVGVAVTRRRSVGERRRQFSIVLVGAAVFVGTNVAMGFVGPLSGQRLEPPEVVPALSWLAIPAAIAVAVVRDGLYELRVFVNRSVMAVAVGAALAAVYFVVLFGVAALFDETVSLSAANLLAAGAVAIICVPVVSGARRRVSRWLGRGMTPLTFAERLREVSSDQPALQELTTLVADELRLGSVQVNVDGLEPTHVGVPDGPEHHLELRRGGTLVGEMVVCARRGESLAATDLRTLGEVARFVAVAVDAIRVNDQLQVSQAALARAHGEERRRVRRDLHDGLGPTLASIRLRLARRRHTTIDAEALDEIFEQVTDAIREVRRIVDGLQPSVLEDLGLVPALQILVNDTRDATALDITFESTGMTPELPADIAAAAYRSVAEALANVTRHSHATACAVYVTMALEDLRVEITDNGNGFQPTAAAAGMGLRSLRNRAAALGGTIDIASHVGEGTCVEVRLPT